MFKDLRDLFFKGGLMLSALFSSFAENDWAMHAKGDFKDNSIPDKAFSLESIDCAKFPDGSIPPEKLVPFIFGGSGQYDPTGSRLIQAIYPSGLTGKLRLVVLWNWEQEIFGIGFWDPLQRDEIGFSIAIEFEETEQLVAGAKLGAFKFGESTVSVGSIRVRDDHFLVFGLPNRRPAEEPGIFCYIYFCDPV
jgi:hypothetical protein